MNGDQEGTVGLVPVKPAPGTADVHEKRNPREHRPVSDTQEEPGISCRELIAHAPGFYVKLGKRNAEKRGKINA